MSDIDSTLRRMLDDRAASVGPDAGVPPEVARRAHRRRLGQQAGVGVMAAIALAAVVLQIQPTERAANVVSVPRPTVVPTVPRPSPTTLITEVGPTTTTPAAGLQPTTTTTVRPPVSVPRVTPPPTIALPAGVPRTFVATTTDGRVVVVDTATGEPVRILTEAVADQQVYDLKLTADRGFGYVTRWRADPCSGEIVVVPFEDSVSGTPVLAPEARPGFMHHAPAPRPGTRNLAYGRSTCGYIGDRTNEVVITSTESEAEHTYPGFRPVGWSPDGKQLVVEDERSLSIVVLDVSAAGEVTGSHPVPYDEGCIRAAVVVAPVSGHLVADMACGVDRHRDLVEIDPATGRSLRTLVAIPNRSALSGGLAYDTSGKHLLYTVTDGVFFLDGDKPVRVAPAGRYVDVAW